MGYFKNLFFVIATMLIIAGNAQAQNTVLAGKDVVSENLDTSAVKVSGARIVGALVADGDQSPTKPDLKAIIPAEWVGESVCMSATSVNGHYSVLRNYGVPSELTAPKVNLEYSTKYPDFLEETNAENFAVLLSKGSCDARSDSFLAAYWNLESISNANNLYILVNSSGGDRVTLYSGEEPSLKPIDCLRIDAPQPRSFDFVCVVPQGQRLSTVMNMELNVTKSGVFDPPTLFSVAMPN